MSAPVKVLFVAGWTRSGSTLLDNLLGEIDGFFSAGELNGLWERALLKGRQCGCGLPVRECRVWSAILQRAFGESPDGPPDARAVVELRNQAVRLRRMPRLLRYRRDGSKPWPALEQYLGILEKLYAAISSATGAHVVVDSSKMPQDAALLPLLSNIDPYLLHLVRDPRGVAHSMTRRVLLQSDDGARVPMPRSTAVESAAGWTKINLATEAVRRRLGAHRSMLVRYEDLVSRPRPALESIAGFVGEPASGIQFRDESTVILHGNHTVWGNPARFKTGAVQLREDNEWTHKLTTGNRIASTALAVPLLRRYGYEMGSSRRSSSISA